MKRATIAALLLPLLGHGANALTVWQGQAILTSVTTGCSPTWEVGDALRSVYRPRGIDDNGTEDRISFNSGRSLYLVRVPNADFSGSGSYTISGWTSRNVGLSGTAGFSAASRTPATSPLPIDTGTLVIRGTINDFFSTDGCTVSFVGNYSKRLD